MTVRDLIARSFRFVHITGDGEDPTATEAQTGLEIMNELVELTAIDKLLAFFQTEIIFPFVPNKFTYTIGPTSTTPDVIATRPVEILSGFTRRDNIDLPLFVGAKQDYDFIQSKNITIAGWGQMVYYQAAYPKATLFFYQVPLDSLTEVHLTVSAQLDPFLDLNDAVTLPPGYNQWLRYTLGKHLAPEFGMTFNQEMMALQIGAEAALKSNNAKPFPVSKSGLIGLGQFGPGGYNIYADTQRGG